MPSTFQHITPTVSDLISGEMISDLPVVISPNGDYEAATVICDRVVRAYQLAQRQPLDSKQCEKLRRRLLFTGGSLHIVIDYFDDTYPHELRKQLNRRLNKIAGMLGITVQHLQQEAARIDATLTNRGR